MSRVIKFRAWGTSTKIMYFLDPANKNGATLYDLYEGKSGTWKVMQFTGLKDKNGVELYQDDLVNVYFTSYEGEHIHDCIYKVNINKMCGIELIFVKLLWESYGYNQYPSSTTLNFEYDNLTEDHRDAKYDRLAVADTWGKNHLLRQECKQNDYSNYIEKIGNIYENPDLLEDS